MARLTDEEIEDVESAISIYRELAEYQTYQDKSLLLQTNANEEHYLTLLYQIISSHAEAVYSQYELNLRSEAFLEELAKALGTDEADAKYVAELLQISASVQGKGKRKRLLMWQRKTPSPHPAFPRNILHLDF